MQHHSSLSRPYTAFPDARLPLLSFLIKRNDIQKIIRCTSSKLSSTFSFLFFSFLTADRAPTCVLENLSSFWTSKHRAVGLVLVAVRVHRRTQTCQPDRWTSARASPRQLLYRPGQDMRHRSRRHASPGEKVPESPGSARRLQLQRPPLAVADANRCRAGSADPRARGPCAARRPRATSASTSRTRIASHGPDRLRDAKRRAAHGTGSAGARAREEEEPQTWRFFAGKS